MKLIQTLFQFSLSSLLLISAVSSVYSSVPSDSELSSVPAWAKEAVWYQIFPERFRNGDPKNDPTVEDIRGSWPHDEPESWSISSWTGDWYKLQTWEQTGRGFYYHAQQRRYGGDLQGVIDKLDYLQDLGITAIYFNPLFESPSLHKYDATMYHHIDNNFGPDPEGDRKIWESEDPADPSTWQWTSADKLFLKLIKEAHARDIRVIIDGVFNHVGQTFWAFEDVKRHGAASQYKDWFFIKSFDNPATPGNEFDYEGWYGVRELPELREDENGLADGPKAHIHAIVKRWMDPNNDGNPEDGIDGWRLDVAEMVALPFWREFRTWVRAINPEAYIVGEVWWEDWNNEKMFNAEPWLRGDAFDAVMNYRVAREAGYFFKAKQRKILATEFLRRLDSLRSEYRPDVNHVLLNLFDSHDTDRLTSQIVNPDTKYDKHVNLNDNKDYDVRKPNDAEMKTLKLMVLFQMTYLGAPMVYYGGEAGMWGADDPDERKPMLWADMKYENEASHPFGSQRPNDRNEFDAGLFAYYKKCIAARKASPALTKGDFVGLLGDDKGDVIAYKRSYSNDIAIVILNNSRMSRSVRVPLPADLRKLKWRNVFDSTRFKISGNHLTIKLNEKSGVVLRATGQ
ncbi:MAG: alpha-glucosidase C-terminal domain-containing protein [Bacteroidetes bacterium]|nr:alpha-glucosidase C-terminal domain-containing protein [Bacteroidota bacterium]MCW5896020.1 alpha-glucosidase C-terminal domain-containing protein [Bacteroidota bacterium]